VTGGPRRLIAGLDPHGVPAPPPAAAAPPGPAIDRAAVDLGELDCDALLDSLHGAGAVPGAAPPAPAATAAPAPAAVPAPPIAPRAAPAAAKKPSARPSVAPEEQTVRVDVRRLDAMVNLVGEMVLARNRLK